MSGERLVSRMEENLLIMAGRRGMGLAIPAIMAGVLCAASFEHPGSCISNVSVRLVQWGG